MAIFKGFSFPFRKGTQSVPEAVTDDELIRQSIIQIILTAPGERVMRPDFGSNAYALVFENNDDLLVDSIRFSVHSAITKFEPRAVVKEVRVDRKDEHVFVTVEYVVLATRTSSTAEVLLPSSAR